MSKEYEEWLSGKILTYCEEFECAQAFEAGQQSQQAKIDELNEVVNGWKDEYRIMTLRYERSKKQIDELQARVDGALDWLNSSSSKNDSAVKHAIDCLKGNKDEN